MTHSDFIQFITDRPAINLKKFAEECGLSQSILWLLANGKRTWLPHHADAITSVAGKYGLKF
jgi:hypothetical protein